MITSNCNCLSSFLWIFCISSMFIIPSNCLITQFSPKIVYLKDRAIYTIITLTILFIDFSLSYFGYQELFRKCSNLKFCFIWINGMVNLIFLIISFLLVMSIYIYNFNKFTNYNYQSELNDNFI